MTIRIYRHWHKSSPAIYESTSMKQTKEQALADQAEFDQAFDSDAGHDGDGADDDAFGLSEAADQAATGAPAGKSGATDSGASQSSGAQALDASAAAQPAAVDPAQGMAARGAELDQREAALVAREAAMRSPNVAERQTSTRAAPQNGDNAADEGAEDENAEARDDPAGALAEDFGPDFVKLITALIQSTCAGMIKDGVGGVAATVDHLIAELTSERQQHHFKSIAAVHADFMEVTASPEFTAWQTRQPAAEQAGIEKVIESGSAQDIIALLTRFKQAGSQNPGSSPNPALDASLNAAEGVRSSGVRLPKEPASAGNYEDAWDEA